MLSVVRHSLAHGLPESKQPLPETSCEHDHKQSTAAL